MAGANAPAGSEGVGEHVRIKSHLAKAPVKLRTERHPHRTKKNLLLLPDRLRSARAPLSKFDPAV
jgi:hypothetical protein